MGEYLPDASESESSERQPPASIEAEQAVLGCIILDPLTCIPECVNALKAGPKAFYDLKHQTIYEALLDMWVGKRHIDLLTLRQELADMMVLKNVGGLQYVSGLPDFASSASNLPHYLDIVVDKFIRRQLIQKASAVVDRAFTDTSPADELAAMASGELAGIASGNKKESTLHTTADLVEVVEARISNLLSLQGALDGLPTGLEDVDKFIRGMKPKEVTIVAARPSAGKSSLGLNIAEHVAVDLGWPVAFFSLEMTADSLMYRLMCGRAKVRPDRIEAGTLEPAEFQRLAEAKDVISAAPLLIDDETELTDAQLRARATMMVERYGTKLFVVDYLQLLQSSRRCGSRQEEVSSVSRNLNIIAKALNVHMVVLAQLNRDSEKGGNREPRVSDLRESGAIEQNADIVTMLWRNVKHQPEDESDGADKFMEVINLKIAKHRNGPTGKVQLAFLKPYTKFTCLQK